MFPLISCGRCHACTHGNPHVCRELRLFGFDLDGGMAQYAKLPVSALMSLPAEMPARIGALIEPLAVAVHGVRRANLDGVQLAVVLGRVRSDCLPRWSHRRAEFRMSSLVM